MSARETIQLLRSRIAELDPPADTELERAWLEEGQRRNHGLAEGKVKGISGERVFENLRARLRRSRV